MEQISFKVDASHHNIRLDVYLFEVLPDIPSRSFVKKFIDSGDVTVNGKIAKAHYKVHADDAIEVGVPEIKEEHLKPENIPLDIFYEDEDIIVIHKPIGMLVHPTPGTNEGTLVNALLYYSQQLSTVNAEGRPGIVHRLDRETSGLILVAKNNKAHAKLAKQFEHHQVKKQYLALAKGSIEFDEGVIDVAIDRHPRYHDRKTVAFHDEAKQAKTFYRVIKRSAGVTLVKLFPETGRTHQLRVHLTHLGHPILGDDKYGQKGSFPRLALHAQAIGFTHPRTGHYVEFSTKPPKEFLKYY